MQWQRHNDDSYNSDNNDNDSDNDEATQTTHNNEAKKNTKPGGRHNTPLATKNKKKKQAFINKGDESVSKKSRESFQNHKEPWMLKEKGSWVVH